MSISQEQHGRPASGSMIDREAIAVNLVRAYRERTFVDAPTRTLSGFAKADALAVAERVRALRIAAGETPAGYKVGFTNVAVRTQFAAEAPLAATVYRETIATGTTVNAGILLGPRIEPEVVVGIGAAGAIAWAAFGFEIVQSHIAGWDFGYLDAIADFGLHAALVIGERRPFDAGTAAAVDAMQVELRCDGDSIERGRGGDVDGGARGSVTWLRDHLRATSRTLEPGDIVSTGSLTRVPGIAAGQRWTIEARGGELAALTIDVI